MSTITDDNGFQISLEPSEKAEEYYKLKVTQVIKYGETRMLPSDVIDDDLLLGLEIEHMKQRIREKVNGYSSEKAQ